MKNRFFSIVLSCVTSLSLLCGCSLSLSTQKEIDPAVEESKQLRAMGIINFEESQKGIPINSKDIKNLLQPGGYYIRHGDVLYPCYTDTKTYKGIGDKPDLEDRFNVFTSESIIDLPTLFEGDSLYYYNPSGVLMYSTFERFRDLGWSIGFRNIKTTPAGYLYLDLKNESSTDICILNSLSAARDLTKGDLFIDKIGGVKVTRDYCANGIITGLIEGVNYDLELYDGTSYRYLSANCNTRYFQSFEMYYIDEYTALQDYLYEITIPDYLLEGYYDVDAKGMFRYVKGKSYSDDTEFNQKLLYQYTTHEEGDMSLAEYKIPDPYSQNDLINRYRAYDEGFFAYEQTRKKTAEEQREEEERKKENEMSQIGLANFMAASRTNTEIWIPAGRPYRITLESEEPTGSITLRFANGKAVHLPYDHIAKTYSYEGSGDNSIVNLEVKGLYSDYQISLINAESYNGQDVAIAEAEAAAKAEEEAKKSK